MADHATQSVEHITKSGQFICRPRRRIFMEHEIFSADGKIARKATRDDIKDIAENMKEAAESGNPAKLTFGHTLDDQFDAKGTLVRHFTEQEQPPARGFWLNPQYEEIKDGKDKGKLALYADQWIQRTLPGDDGKPTDGPSYAATFPGRSAEYLKRKKIIDSVALLRRTPALDLGIDILPYQAAHADRVFYSAPVDAGGKIACVEDSRGKWRYAYEEPMDEEPANSPAAPADDRVPSAGAGSDGWPPEHQKFAEEAMSRTCGMHHTHAKALMHHMHAMYGGQLGLPPDMLTPHGATAPGTPAAGPAAPPAAGAAPGGKGEPPHHMPAHAPTSTPSGPGAPMKPETEKERMQAEQDQLERQRYSARLTALETELAAQKQLSVAAEERAMYASFEGQLKQLYMEGRDSINVAKEVETCKSRKYSQQQLDWHIEGLRRIPPGDALVTGPMVRTLETPMPQRHQESATQYSGDAKRDYDRSLEVQRYARANGKSMEDAEKWWVETHLNGAQLNGSAR